MIRLGIVAEGQTEVEFIGKVLAQSLRKGGVEPTAIPLRGNVSVQTVSNRLHNAYWSFDAVTSLVDFYGFRGKGEATVGALEERIGEQVRSRIGRDWAARRVFPYVQMHEFEALLFADAAAFAAINAPPEAIDEIRAIRSGFTTPEDIDDDPATAPSKRIAAIVPRYHKVRDGADVAAAVGLRAMRAACPRFDTWMTRLEALDAEFAGSSRGG